ncbi:MULTISPECIES: dipeptidyl-peptidase 3 family protein [unclassified Carboxylicivirga]|uniref:dipeptidyl-peptidase 3 family protein n=1 Tax=Carboxylicivirga TaxID=1628153 RepID=UPI003D345EAC
MKRDIKERINIDEFPYQIEQFGDLRILRYRIPNFEKLPLQQKQYIYYLSEAALSGRDIIWDQNNAHNLWLRRCLDVIYQCVDKQDEHYKQLEDFYKRVLFSNGVHHHYSTDKLVPGFSEASLRRWIEALAPEALHELGSDTAQELFQGLHNLLFDASFQARRVCQDEGKDVVAASANNYYQGLTQAEAEAFYRQRQESDGAQPVSYGLNTRLVKTAKGIEEEVWRLGGRYDASLKRIVHWLKKAEKVAENDVQRKVISILIQFYETGDLKIFDTYSIEWLKEQEGSIDFINGFIEVYGDALGYKGAWESLVNIVDREETSKATRISENAQWFEDHSPVHSAHRKEKVQGVSMKVINALMLGGDCYPAAPLGINLPNAEWIREQHGSKSVSLQNISEAHEMASLNSGVLEEFAFDQQEIELHRKYGALADHLHTHLHECVGHGSGKLEDGVRTDALKAYGSVIEEARADLFGLYFIADEKMQELGLVPNAEVAKAQYNAYIRNGLMVQLARISEGANIEQTHMRNRQLVASWVFEKGGSDVIEMRRMEDKTYFVVKDHAKLRTLFGELLKEVQRIKSQGDYEAARQLVEQYGVKVDQQLHAEVKERYSRLKVAPYSGFLNPRLTPVYDHDGAIKGVSISYDENFMEQMQRYNRDYSFEK